MQAPTPQEYASDLGQRRRLTLLFTDLCGSTALSRQTEPETYRQLIHQLRRIWHDVAARWQGRLVSAQGDGALIAFGLQGVGERDGFHAARAALEIGQAVAALVPADLPLGCLPLAMHGGIHAGTLLLADGDIERGLFDLTGDVANVAASLAKCARAGQVLVTREALGPYLDDFQLASAEAAAQATQAADTSWGPLACLTGAHPGSRARAATADARQPPELTPYIERDAVLGQLLAFAQTSAHALRDDAGRRAPDGWPRCLMVQGEAGMGKSRLLRQFTQAAAQRGLPVLSGEFDRAAAAGALQPFLQMLGAQLPAPGEAPAHTLPRQLLALLQRQSGLLVLDDWQWADDASRRVLGELLESDTTLRVVLACRPNDDGRPWIAGAQVLHLRPFDRTESDATVARWLPQADPFERQRIHAESGGVPLFIEELCHGAAHRPVRPLPLSSAAGMAGKYAPARGYGWLAALVLSRLEHLPYEVVQLVQAAAVVGVRVPAGLLVAALGHEPAPDALARASAADLLHAQEDGAVLRFKHGITRAAVYDAIGLADRRRMHARVARQLSDGLPAERLVELCEALAYHHEGAGHADLAANFAEMAGVKAATTSAVDLAKSQFRRALDQLERLPDDDARYLRWRSVVRRLGFMSVFDPSPDEPALFGQAAALARRHADLAGEAFAAYWHGYVRYARGEVALSLAACREAVQRAREQGDRVLVVQARIALGQALQSAGRHDEAEPLLGLASAVLEAQPKPGPLQAPALGYALACLGTLHGDRGEFQAADACFERALTLVPWPGHEVEASILCWRAAMALWRGDGAAAEQDALTARRIGDKVRSLYLYGMSSSLLACARWLQQPASEHAEDLRQSTAWLARHGNLLTVSLCHGWLATMAAELGRPDQARLHAAQALWRLRGGDPYGAVPALRALARVALRRGRPDEAARRLARADALAQRRQSGHEQARNRLVEAELAEARGQAGAAQALRQQAQADAQRMGLVRL